MKQSHVHLYLGCHMTLALSHSWLLLLIFIEHLLCTDISAPTVTSMVIVARRTLAGRPGSHPGSVAFLCTRAGHLTSLPNVLVMKWDWSLCSSKCIMRFSTAISPPHHHEPNLTTSYNQPSPSYSAVPSVKQPVTLSPPLPPAGEIQGWFCLSTGPSGRLDTDQVKLLGAATEQITGPAGLAD